MLTAESYLEILDFRMKTNSGRIRSNGERSCGLILEEERLF